MNRFDAIQRLRRRVSARLVGSVLHDVGDSTQPLPRRGIHRILICRSIRTLGNSLTLTPLVDELARVYPGAEVDIVSRSKVARELFGGFANMRDLWILPQHMPGHAIATATAFRRMRRKGYDLAIDPDPRSQSGRLMLAMAHARLALGYVGAGKQGAVTHGVAVPVEVRHKAMLPVYLLRKALGEDPTGAAFPLPSLPLTATELETGWHTAARVAARVGAGPRIAVFANATGDKLLPLAWWQEFLSTFTALVPDARIVELVPASGRSMLADAYPAYFTSDVRHLAAFIANMDACIASDSGVMHLAWASGTPTLGVFSVTDPAQWGPYGGGSGSIHVAGRSAPDAAGMGATWWQQALALRQAVPVM
ncbi:MAG: lipopolysaccharide heptosyltransferase family protein [Rhodanobacter sp.]|nr:MAG: lipopolysaccharide heptosyltransferase family protein [Rhodanobacter sp.]TAM13776.1 MAG: lipopolysaccharide heptosyltransferase family protein [Rhodanobacter sp.]TAM34500.1 MAG: lipopolysaccharide heptosyltransferase family protein [Rhodanobacter sp.]